MITCKECGNTYDEAYGVCPKCGRPCEQELTKNNVYVPPMPAPMQTLTPKKKNSKVKLITILSIAGVVLVGLIIALVMIFSQPDVQAQVKEQLSLGEKYLLEEDYDEAIVAFKKAIDIQPNNPELYMKLSDAYIAKGDTENAIKALEDGYAKTGSEDIKKKLDELKLNLQYAKYIEDGKTALSNNEYNTAIENFENAVALKPNEVEPYLSAADGYIGNSDDDGAIAILEKGYEQTNSQEIKERIDELSVKVIASGTCGKDGDNVIWTVYENGKLKFSGDGEIAVYLRQITSAPWAEYMCTKLVIGEGITNIPEETIWTLPKSSISVDKNNKNYICEDGVLFDINKTKLIMYPTDKTDKIYTVPNGVEYIGHRAFNHCNNLTNIEIPNSVTSIGDSAFLACANLTGIEIPNSVISIGDSAFFNCTSLTSIEIPNSVTSIGEWAFYYCTNLTSIKIPNSVTSIGENAFGYCTSLTSIEIPNSMTDIGNGVFSDCTSLITIEIPNSVTYIGNGAFSGCTSLTNIEIPNSVTSIDGWAFNDWTSSQTIYMKGRSFAPATWSIYWNYNCNAKIVWNA